MPDGMWYTCGVFLHSMVRHVTAPRSQSVSAKNKTVGAELGFQKVGITDTDLSASEPKLQAWLDKQYHGEMEWMARHGMMRARPHELLPGTLRVISVRMNYLPANAAFARTLKKSLSRLR
ncbi:electron transport protein YjeS [Enterobacter cloacae]|uniref:Electron transport protein YjeS n=1 Tax=Enterobacter cloacae TaxID=550 RepID=A0A377M9K3_ENTCL|nr:electron transport protein YjeS [Enterobacter cloacae]